MVILAHAGIHFYLTLPVHAAFGLVEEPDERAVVRDVTPAKGRVEKPGRQECLPHFPSCKFLSLSGADTPVRVPGGQNWGFSTRPKAGLHSAHRKENGFPRARE